VCESTRDKLCHRQNFMSKFEVSEFFRAFEFYWGDGAVYQPWTLPQLFSATTMIIDTNGTSYESL
jgi:hypothetical protein